MNREVANQKRDDNHGKVIRVSVSDSTTMASQLLAEALSRNRRFRVSQAPLDASAIAAAKAEVNLISRSFGERTGKTPDGLMKELLTLQPDARVIALLEESERDSVIRALRSGVRGVFCRNQQLKLLAKSIECVYAGEIWITQPHVEWLVDALTNPVPVRIVDAKGTELLSAREQQVVYWVVEGLTNRQIGDRLKLSEHTVKNYLFRIFDKVGVSTRVELILYVVTQLANSHRPNHHTGYISAERAALLALRQAVERCKAVSQKLSAGKGEEQVASETWLSTADSITTELRRSLSEAEDRITTKAEEDSSAA